MVGNFLSALKVVIEPSQLLYIFSGTIIGLFFGAVPGLNATLAMVLILPLTYGLGIFSGTGVMLGAYVGGITGGIISAIMIGIPGTAASIATVFDGHPLAKKGKGSKALSVAASASFYGGFFSWVALILFTPLLSKFALKIGPFEYTAIIIFGFTIIIGMSSDNIKKSLMMAAIGLIIPAIGLDPLHGVPRLTFGVRALDTGFGLVPLLSGVYVVSRSLEESEYPMEKYISPPGKIKNVFNQIWRIWRYWKTLIRSSIIGILIGILPGIGASVAPFIAYDQAKRTSKHPETFGHGEIEGIIASEACNNATIGGALIPGVALGIPGDIPVVILISSLMLHGFQPGPLFLTQQSNLAYVLFLSFLIANIIMIIVLLTFGIKLFSKLMTMSKIFLIPIIFVAGLIGAYNVAYSMTDVWVSLIGGLIAYVAIKADYPIAPMVIAIILGQILESQLRIALTVSKGSILPLFTSPISLVFILLTLLSVVLIIRKNHKTKNVEAK